MSTEAQQLAVALARLDTMFGDIADIKATLRELTIAVARLAVIEERQHAAGAAQDRAFEAISKLQARVATLEAAQPIQKQSSDIVQKAVSLLIAAALGAGIVGLIRPASADASPVIVERRP